MKDFGKGTQGQQGRPGQGQGQGWNDQKNPQGGQNRPQQPGQGGQNQGGRKDEPSRGPR